LENIDSLYRLSGVEIMNGFHLILFHGITNDLIYVLTQTIPQ